ncbi:MAG: acetyl-CoA carboxylase biotin carboxylase subunit [Elusimicrobia bacterium]|nr:acetyl-CoA carboxylase biotin carboxylase subunit [Elusimicrobiota bacterium]MBI3012254.1 acetyl-CoA carboxylase biotin carboxylase subunit [Elusimicrobiota bacterium]MBI4218397.1 acetyl-CoA carboxylase biotin carboxylase subunit [Elusimicrobiota bacterium]
MFKRILIANRGEIAVRIIRACREMGIQTVAIHSETDRESLHVRAADKTICVGPGPAADSYLNVPSIISACEISGSDAVHPGYGFLSENEDFAEVCEAHGLTFIGPSRDSIAKMGNKIEAKKIAKKSGVELIPGSENGVNPDDPNLSKLARKIGYPLIVKAAGGGGGKGMRVVTHEEALLEMVRLASSEAKLAFSDGNVYLEKFIEEPRHVEVQILADKKGKVVYLPERDCSVQRRYQKLIEESPSPAVDSKLRKKLGKAARRIAEEVGYHTVGTIEFLLDKKGDFYFMEMNTRVQVEHPVTEMLTGLDLVQWQIRLAAGETLDFDEDDVRLCGHAMECRINAEDPDHDFVPNPGKIEHVIFPGGPGVRVDSHIFSGYTVPSYYDSLLAKVIVSHKDRESAITRMRRALGEFQIVGVKTTLPFHEKVLEHDAFRYGDITTNFIAKHIFGGER